MLLFLAFVAMPIIEIAVLIQAGQAIGTWPVIGLVILTALIGSIALRAQGMSAMRRAQSGDLRDLPMAMTDGLLLMIAGVLLLTPGFVTDAFGLSLLVPPVRRLVAKQLRSRIVTMETRRGRPGREQGGTHAKADTAPHDGDVDDAVILSQSPKRDKD